jgi:hypothetical protein
MKGVTKTLKIIAIVLNAILLAGILFDMCRYGVWPRTLLYMDAFILILFPAVTLVTIALTFRKEGKMPACVLKVIAIIVNILFLISGGLWAVAGLHNGIRIACCKRCNFSFDI